MRPFRGPALLAALLAPVLAMTGCDKSDPLLVGEQTIAVTFKGIGNSPQYNVWDMHEDSDMDGEPDDTDGDGDPDQWLWCEALQGLPADPTMRPSSLPWNFSVQISVIRAGTTGEVQITSNDALAVDFNLSRYDSAESRRFTFAKNPITIDDMGTLRTFVFTNPRKFTALHRDVVRATFNPLSAIDPITYPYQDGLCSLQDPGDANVDDQGIPYTLSLNKGDTVIVRARRGLIPPAFTVPAGFQPLYSTEPTIDASMTIDGTPLTNGASTQINFGSPLTITFSTR